ADAGGRPGTVRAGPGPAIRAARGGGIHRRAGVPDAAVERAGKMIRIEGVGHRIGRAQILEGIDLTLPEGRLTALIGPNGGGKSPLLSLIARLEPLQQGRISVAGLDVARTPTEALARALAILPQNAGVASRLRVRELVAFGRWPHHRGRPGPQDRALVEEAI